MNVEEDGEGWREKKIPEKRFLAKKNFHGVSRRQEKKISSFVTETADAKKLLTALVKDRAERNDDSFLSPSLSLSLFLSFSLSIYYAIFQLVQW